MESPIIDTQKNIETQESQIAHAIDLLASAVADMAYQFQRIADVVEREQNA